MNLWEIFPSICGYERIGDQVRLCIRYFVGVEEVAAKIRHKFRCLDDEWAA